MKEHKLTVPMGMGDIRLDVFISSQELEISRAHAQKLIASGCVSMPPRAKPSYKLKAGETVAFTVPDSEPDALMPEAIPLDIIYEDSSIIVINKLRGMVVHPAPGHGTGTLVSALLAHCGDLSGIGGVARPGIVHRIDKDTTGLLVAAKNDAAHASLSEQLKDRTLHRNYLALVEGNVAEDGGVDAPIGRSARDRKRMAVVSGGREAQTSYRIVERFGEMTLLELSLRTGRTHQIRVHMAHISHPVVGDYVYGRAKQPFGLKGQLLHAFRLGLIHPVTGELMEFTADIPSDFQDVLERLRRKRP